MCHGHPPKGDISDGNYEAFCLAFENEKGELYKVTPGELETRLRVNRLDDLSDIKVVFLNACYSESISQVFLDHQVGCVISVSSHHKVFEKYAEIIAGKFYSCLIDSKTVEDSWHHALELGRTEAKTNSICCCHHPHTNECVWNSRRMKSANAGSPESNEQWHQVHVPTCNCKNKNNNLHDGCEWGWNFKYEYVDKEDHSCYSDEWEKNQEDTICCCHPELHDEWLKFRASYKSAEFRQEVIFNSLEEDPGQVPTTHFTEPEWNQVKLFGKNIPVYKLFSRIIDDTSKCLNLYGEPGSGKTSVCQV